MPSIMSFSNHIEMQFPVWHAAFSEAINNIVKQGEVFHGSPVYRALHGGSVNDRYSYLSVTIGSSRDARQAGSQLAMAATAVIVAVATTNVVVSVGPTPKSRDATSRFKVSAPARPRILPPSVSKSPCLMIPESTVERVAPRASRIPI